MEILPTFVPRLYTFHYPNIGFDELQRIFKEWKDVEFLTNFFTENEQDLHGEYSIEEAVVTTKSYAKRFEKKMRILVNSDSDELNRFFANLNNDEYRVKELQRQKAKQNWLRLYALRISQEDMEDLYVITGGMIKLTLRMEERDHGIEELNKINRCRDYLKSIGVYDLDSFIEICL